MAKTKDEITEIVSKRLYQTHYEALVFADLVTAVGGLTTLQKTKLMDGIIEGQELAVGTFLHELMIDVANAKADVEATNLMADDNLTLAELQLIF